MSRHELTPQAKAVVVTRGVVGWDRPLQTFFAQLFSIGDEGEEQAHVWIGTYPRELDSAAAALAVVATDCMIPEGLAAILETDRLASVGVGDGPSQAKLKSVLARPVPSKRS